MPKFGTRNACFGCFELEFWKQCCHIWNQQPQICLFAKIWRKTKVPKFGTRNAWKHTNVLKLEFENSILIFEINTLEFVYLKNLAKKKKKKIPLKFGIKNVLFVYFSARIWKMLLWYLKSASCSLPFSKIGPKTPDFWYFWVGIWRLFCYI